MLGCDYTTSIKGVGPKRAIELIRTHKSLEKILENLDKTKYPVPEDWNYKAARQLLMEKRKILFWTPCVAHCIDLILEDFEKKLEVHQVIIAKRRRITSYIFKELFLFPC